MRDILGQVYCYEINIQKKLKQIGSNKYQSWQSLSVNHHIKIIQFKCSLTHPLVIAPIPFLARLTAISGRNNTVSSAFDIWWIAAVIANFFISSWSSSTSRICCYCHTNSRIANLMKGILFHNTVVTINLQYINRWIHWLWYNDGLTSEDLYCFAKDLDSYLCICCIRKMYLYFCHWNIHNHIFCLGVCETLYLICGVWVEWKMFLDTQTEL